MYLSAFVENLVTSAQSEKTPLEIYKEELQGRIEQLMRGALATLDTLPIEQDSEYPNYLRVTYELWCDGLGVLEGLCCLQGVPQELRRRSMRLAVQNGKSHVLHSHMKRCPGCSGSERLQAELDSVN